MDKSQVMMVFRSPYKPLVEAALSYVNLTEKEEEIVQYYFLKGLTEEATAEVICHSRDYVAKHKKTIIEKCSKAWERCPNLIAQAIDY